MDKTHKTFLCKIYKIGYYVLEAFVLFNEHPFIKLLSMICIFLNLIFDKIPYESSELHELIKSQYKSINKNVIAYMRKNPAYADKAKILEDALLRLENKNFSGKTIIEIRNIIKNDLRIAMEEYKGNFTPNDANNIFNQYLQNFTINMYQYPEFCNFINMAITLNNEQELSRLLNDIQGNFDEVWSKLNNTKEYKYINDDHKFYCDQYTYPLFLHKNKPHKISLQDIFVIPSATVQDQNMWFDLNDNKIGSIKYMNIFTAIREFVENEQTQSKISTNKTILFIEGRAATGKSSLVSWLSWNYYNESQCVDFIFSKSKIFIIRMRNLPKCGNSSLNLHNPLLQFYAYIYKLDEINDNSVYLYSEKYIELFQNSILILDGYDELCMLEDISREGKENYINSIISQISYDGINMKVIITTRSEYINYNMINNSVSVITIDEFDSAKRKEWVLRFEKKQKLDEYKKSYLISDQSSVLEGIIGCPLMLYIIGSSDIKLDDDPQLWFFYNRIFDHEIFEKKYSAIQSHDIIRYQNTLLRLMREIANLLIQRNSFSAKITQLLSTSEIENLINEISDEKKGLSSILSDCFGIATYMRFNHGYSDDDSAGFVEFYHNNIRDYYYCEYLWEKLKVMFTKFPQKDEDKDKWFILGFQKLFYSSNIISNTNIKSTSKPIDFLESKITYYMSHNKKNKILECDKRYHFFRRYFGRMLTTSFLFEYKYTEDLNIIKAINQIASSLFIFFHTLYFPKSCSPISQKYFEIYDSCDSQDIVQNINNNNLTRFILNLSIWDYSYTNFANLKFNNIYVHNKTFDNCNFKDCFFNKCTFVNCSFMGCDFTGASLNNVVFKECEMDYQTNTYSIKRINNLMISHTLIPYFERLKDRFPSFFCLKGIYCINPNDDFDII